MSAVSRGDDALDRGWYDDDPVEHACEICGEFVEQWELIQLDPPVCRHCEVTSAEALDDANPDAERPYTLDEEDTA